MQVFVMQVVGTSKAPFWHSPTPALRPTQMMRNTWMPDLTRRRWRKPSTISYCGWRKKKRRASRTWPLYCPSCPSLHKVPFAPCPWPTRSRQVFSQRWIKIPPICSFCRSFGCTDTLRITGQTGISRDSLFFGVINRDIPGYPRLSQQIPRLSLT